MKKLFTLGEGPGMREKNTQPYFQNRCGLEFLSDEYLASPQPLSGTENIFIIYVPGRRGAKEVLPSPAINLL